MSNMTDLNTTLAAVNDAAALLAAAAEDAVRVTGRLAAKLDVLSAALEVVAAAADEITLDDS